MRASIVIICTVSNISFKQRIIWDSNTIEFNFENEFHTTFMRLESTITILSKESVDVSTERFISLRG